MQERRKNVRVRPSPDYDIRIEYEEGLVKVRLSVSDLAVGGIGVLLDELFADLPLDGLLRVRVTLPGVEPFETDASLRHSARKPGGRSGFHFAALTPEQQKAWGRAVSELLERGHSV